MPLENNKNNNNNNNSVSYSLDSNNTTLSSYGSIVNTTQTLTDSLDTEKESIETLVHSKKLFKSISDNLSSHSANQFEHNMSAAATATVTLNSSKQTSSTLPQPTSTSSSSSLSSSSITNQPISNSSGAVNKTNSTSYLDESNLKLAVIDYPDILKLIKLQNSIEYQEWLAFNSELLFLFLSNFFMRLRTFHECIMALIKSSIIISVFKAVDFSIKTK